MEKLGKNWFLEIILAALLTAILGLGGWTANKVVQISENVVRVEAELQKEITEVRAELGREIAVLNAKMDLLISGLNITVAPKDEAGAEASGG